MAIQTILWTDVVKSTWLTKINANFTDLDTRKVNNTGDETIGGEKTFSDDLKVWTNDLFVDVDANKVWFWTITPREQVEISTASWTSCDLLLSEASAYGWRMRNNQNWNNFELSWTSDFSAYSTRLAIDTAGNVWIGTTSPWEKLNIVWNIKLNYTWIIWSWEKELNNISFYWNTWRTNPSASIVAYNNGWQFDDTANIWFRTSSTSDIPTEYMTINTTGNVWIGTTSPTKKLEVNWWISLTDNATRSLNWSYFAWNSGATTPSATISTWLIVGWNKSNWDGETNLVYWTSAWIKPRLDFASWDWTTYTTEMTLKAGNVWINDTTPDEKLSIDSWNIMLDSFWEWNGSWIFFRNWFSPNWADSAQKYNMSITAQDFSWANSDWWVISFFDWIALMTWTSSYNTSNIWLFVNSSQNVWIGTTSPSAKLESHNNAVISTQSNPQLALVDSDNTNLIMRFFVDDTVDTNWAWAIQMTENWVSNDRALLLNPHSGNVWIGTTSPGEKLEVNWNIQCNWTLIYWLNKNLASWTDLDTVLTAWFYDVNNPVNWPTTWWFHIEVQVYSGSSSFVSQRAYWLSSGNSWKMWIRSSDSWTFVAWKLVTAV